MQQLALWSNGLPGKTVAFAAKAAGQIRLLGKRAATDIVRIGQWLHCVKNGVPGKEEETKLPHGSWLPWLNAEFGWSDRQARRFLNVYAACKSDKLSNMDIDVSSLYLLAAPKTDPKVRERVFERGEAGEPITRDVVREEEQRQQVTKYPSAMLKFLQNVGMTISVIERGGGIAAVARDWTRELAELAAGEFEVYSKTMAGYGSALRQKLKKGEYQDERKTA